MQDFDPYPMVRKAAAALILNGPMTQQERWEENEGYSPSSLAATIAALICAASFADKIRIRSWRVSSLNTQISWSRTWSSGPSRRLPFLPNVRHFIRILPTFVKGDASRAGPLGVPAAPAPDGDPNEAVVSVANWNIRKSPRGISWTQGSWNWSVTGSGRQMTP